ncbi:MAG: carbohydrate ABC transporter permease [Xylanivirga thermophila]|jgi:ABC-type glycerol-3-phosphate transport system permease component|uniref:carbohydrate ABC transporter permease n=1 Tax=Xylanivirga thermophila TaxID=2496273 RepID=UPI00101DC12C|nr:carbohydrate ABC transporter permease [Xylanivirga thermophila]
MKQKINKVALNALLIALGILTIFPFVWMIFSSFKSNVEINALTQTLIPKNFTVENYISMNENFNFMRFFGNSLFISFVVTIIICYTSTISGFVLSKYQFRGRDLIFSFIMGTMMIPWAVTIIPKYSIIRKLGWMDSYIALIVPAFFSGFGTFMLRQYCMTIPDDILEAARIDGANEFYIFHRIVMPMCRNAISSIAIFQFLWAWEDYLWPFIVITDEKKQMLSVGLKMFNGRFSTDYGGLFAATTVSIIPVIIVYLFFQNRFIDGITASAIKG